MIDKVKKEVEELIKKLDLSCSIEKFQDKVNWDQLSREQKLSEDLIREYSNKLEWVYISQFQTLSEDFIEEFLSEVVLYYISSHQKLSEKFIRKHTKILDWFCIAEHQELSEDFRKEFANEIFDGRERIGEFGYGKNRLEKKMAEQKKEFWSYPTKRYLAYEKVTKNPKKADFFAFIDRQKNKFMKIHPELVGLDGKIKWQCDYLFTKFIEEQAELAAKKL